VLTAKNKLLKTVVDSKDGIHLTIYVRIDGDMEVFRKRLDQLLKTADEHLSPVLSHEEKEKFLKPVHALSFEDDTLKNFTGHIGIFRKKDFFRFIRIPTEIEETCVVADTFHIKPLIKWAQQDQDFIFLGFTDSGVNVYKGSLTEFKKIDEVFYKRPKNNGRVAATRSEKREIKKSIEWFATYLSDLIGSASSVVFVAGPSDYVKPFIKKFKSENLYPETIASLYTSENLSEICRYIRSRLRLYSRTKLDEILKEFELAQKMKIAKINIFQIAKAAIQGRVKKLVVAEDLNIFGKLDLATGGVSIHPLDLDHEDDCLLDDLAQTVLLKGGEVVVAKRSEIPKGRPIVAVLRGSQSELQPMTPKFNEFSV